MHEIIELAVQLREAAIAWFPRLAASIGLLLVGWFTAVLLRTIVRRVLRGLTRIIPKKSSGFEAAAIHLCGKAEGIFPAVTFWIVLLFFAAAAVETLGLPILTAWIGEVVKYLPNILMGLLIVFGGLWAGGAIGAFTAKALVGTRHGTLMGRIAQFSIAAVSVSAVVTPEVISSVSVSIAAVISSVVTARRPWWPFNITFRFWEKGFSGKF